MKKIILSLLFLLSLFVVRVIVIESLLDIPSYNFYHWKQNYTVSVDEPTPPKYIKVLDIHYDKGLKIFRTTFKTLPEKRIIPVLYIDNSVFLNLDESTVVEKVLSSLKKLPKTLEYSEIQIDCDWTAKTKEHYFSFLTKLKKATYKKLSATIRLHQVKYYQKTGVPPVDSGVLMYYNMSDFLDTQTKNYILDLAVAKRYHYNFKEYPLPLDLALPIYSQATILRFSKVVGLIEGVRAKDITNEFKALDANHYKVLKTHYFKKHLLYEDDILRVDEVSAKDLQYAITQLKEVMKKPKKIIFYRWGNKQEYPKDFEEKLVW
jgi:hypothetical protein